MSHKDISFVYVSEHHSTYGFVVYSCLRIKQLTVDGLNQTLRPWPICFYTLNRSYFVAIQLFHCNFHCHCFFGRTRCGNFACYEHTDFTSRRGKEHNELLLYSLHNNTRLMAELIPISLFTYVKAMGYYCRTFSVLTITLDLPISITMERYTHCARHNFQVLMVIVYCWE